MLNFLKVFFILILIFHFSIRTLFDDHVALYALISAPIIVNVMVLFEQWICWKYLVGHGKVKWMSYLVQTLVFIYSNFYISFRVVFLLMLLLLLFDCFNFFLLFVKIFGLLNLTDISLLFITLMFMPILKKTIFQTKPMHK